MSTTNQKVSAIQSREIRVFLSSTFRDMEAERNHLVKQVFPKVRAACLARQVGFTEIDLRWGVTEEESKNGATVEICLKEIERCRNFPPFFIGFLGERYGWIPKHEDLTAYWQKHKGSSYAKPILNAVKRGISVTELEMELAVLEEGAAEKIASHALFLLRDRTLTDSLYRQETGKTPNPADPAFYDPAAGKLDTLKERIRQTPFLGIDGYTSVEQFGEAVETYLVDQLDRHFPEDAVPTPLERQRLAHEAFRYHRLQNFLPCEDVRKHVIKALQKRLHAPHLGPVLLAGPSGQGKSALMADLARHLETSHPEWIVLDHYIGADDTNSLDSWARRILETLHPRIHDLVGAVPEAPKDQKEALSTWIAMACRQQEQNSGQEAGRTRLILILDALDQCSDGGKDLELLKPEIFGPDALVIASAVDDTPAWEAANDYETQVVPPLTAELKVRMIRDTLARYRKKLIPDLAQRLADAPQSGSPLFLSLALEELRLDASHESLAELVGDILKAKDAEELFLNNFLLDEDYGRPELPTLAAAFMALLGASHAGLSENELADLLALPGDPKAKDTKKPRLPQIHLSRLLANLQPFLLNKAGRRAPMHNIFGRAALDYYDTVPVREHLYDHFKTGYGKGKNEFDTRGAAEALYQITQLANTEHDNQKNARKRLVADLGCLQVPLNLHDKNEQSKKIVLDALTSLADKEKSALAGRWKKGIEAFDADDCEKAGPSVREFGNWLEERAIFALALAVLEELFARQTTVLATDHKERAATANSLGLLYQRLARFDEAQALFNESLVIREKVLGLKHPDTATSLNNLAWLLYLTFDYKVAELNFRRALAIREKTLGPEHPDTAMSLNDLAVLLNKAGNHAAAERLQRRALAIYEKALGPEHPNTAMSLNNLALMLEDRQEAEMLYRRALAICEKTLGPEHPNTALVLSGIASLVVTLAVREPLQRRSLAIYKKVLGPDHPDTIRSLEILTMMLMFTGDGVE
jgi:nephrocystin-3